MGLVLLPLFCVRDHWQEISEDERDWCIDMVCIEVNRQADVWNDSVHRQRFDMQADRSGASIIPLLLKKPLSETQKLRVPGSVHECTNPSKQRSALAHSASHRRTFMVYRSGIDHSMRKCARHRGGIH